MIVTLWSIWTARQKAIHEGTLQSRHATHSFVTNFIAEMEVFRRPVTISSAPGGSVSNSRQAWKEPGAGLVKIHVDGSFSRADERSCSWGLRRL